MKISKFKNAVLLSIVWAGVLVVSSGLQAQTVLETGQAGVNSRIEVLSSTFASAPSPVASQSRIYVYRPSTSTQLAGATGVFINGQYHTSLIAGGYSHLCVAPGEVEIGARQMRVGRSATDKLDSITAALTPAAQNQYFVVTEQAGRPVIQPVSIQQAMKEMVGVRLQVHTISRVSPALECQQGAAQAPSQAAVQEPVVAQKYTLSDKALFAFGRGDEAGLTREGMAALKRMVSSLGANYAQIIHIHVIGHADPLGSAQINERLATERANTVRRYIERSQQLDARITAEGRSARELAQPSCPALSTRRGIECNQPNRRVEIEVLGHRR